MKKKKQKNTKQINILESNFFFKNFAQTGQIVKKAKRSWTQANRKICIESASWFAKQRVGNPIDHLIHVFTNLWERKMVQYPRALQMGVWYCTILVAARYKQAVVVYEITWK